MHHGQAPTHHAAGDPSARQRVLVVDDNRDAADMLATLLRLDDVQVEVAYDGPSALEAVDRYHPGAVVLDLGMPGMSGYDVARSIRGRHEFDDVTLIALTGWGLESDRRMTAAVGFNHHLTKPADIEMVQAVLSAAA